MLAGATKGGSVSSTEWDEPGEEEAEVVDPDEIDDVPGGSVDEVTGAEGETGAGSGWTPGGGTLGPESSDDV
jgi:hypothetical protein